MLFPKALSALTSRRCYSLFEIRLEEDCIIFRGNEFESAGQLLKGVVVLCLPQAIRLEVCMLRLTAIQQSCIKATAGKRFDRTITLLSYDWPAFVGTQGETNTLPKGNHEFPFEYLLPGNAAESIEGIPEVSITYWLEAIISRGKFAFNLCTSKRFRVMRAISDGSQNSQAMVVEEPWPDKVNYRIEVPRAVVFGGSMCLVVVLSPLIEGLKLGNIIATLVETRKFMVKSLGDRTDELSKNVASWHIKTDGDDHEHNALDTLDGFEPKTWRAIEILELPGHLRQCTQDLEYHGIKIRHRLEVTVTLINPDGHISAINTKFPVVIVMSRDSQFSESGRLLSHAMPSAPPPRYEEHRLDQSYDSHHLHFCGVQAWGGGSSGSHCRHGWLQRFCSRRHCRNKTQSLECAELADVNHSLGQSSDQLLFDSTIPFDTNEVPSYATAIQTRPPTRRWPTGGFLPNYEATIDIPRAPWDTQSSERTLRGQ